MIFSAPTFLFVFLPTVLLVWFISRRSKIVLLMASLLFYAWGEPVFVLLLIFVILFNYWVGELIGRYRTRPLAFVFGISIDIAILVTFKYAGFILSNLNAVIEYIGLSAIPVPQIPLPLGVSFFVFQAVAYLSDIYRGRIAPSHSLFRFALFKSFFPQLIAGPIVRYQQVADDFASDRSTETIFANGIARFTIGLAKKVVIADNLAPLVDRVFDMPSAELGFAVAWLGVVCFALQIYFDFSGYSDMAIGLGKMFGIGLPENFRHPYTATSIREFWRRWHITLSTWFRDYLYIPMGGSRGGALHTYVNLLTVFVLCGLWHGPSWTFVAWGLFHGMFLALERTAFGRLVNDLPIVFRNGYMLLVVLFGWALFRSPTMSYAVGLLQAMVGLHGWDSLAHPLALFVDPFVALIMVVGAIASVPWTCPPMWTQKVLRTVSIEGGSGLLGSLGYVTSLTLLMILSTAFVATQTHRAFIYFRF